MQTTNIFNLTTVSPLISIPKRRTAQPLSQPTRPSLIAKWTRIEGKMICRWVKE